MKKIILAVIAVALLGLGAAACSDEFRNSPEQKAFRAFVEKCKADPTTPDCVAWKEKSGPN
jgi:hypothetical protein